MTITDLEEKAEKLRLELREIALEQSEIAVLWQEQRVATDMSTRANIKHQLDVVKLELTQVENKLRGCKRAAKMDFADALCFVCEREGHKSFIEEATELAEVG